MSRLTFYIVCGLWLLAFSTQAQYLTQAQLKHVRGILAENKKDTSNVHAYLDLAIYYTNRPAKRSTDLDSALFLCHEALALSKKINFPRGMASSYMRGANVLRPKGDFVKEKEYLEKAAQLYADNKLYDGLANTYMVMAYSWKDRQYIDKAIKVSRDHHNLKRERWALIISAELYDEVLDYKNSHTEWLKALAISQKAGIDFSADDYGKLALSLSAIGEYQQALKYGLESIRIVEATHDSTILVANIYNRLGNTYYALKKPKEAIACFQKAVNIAQFYLDDLSFFTMLTNTATVMASQKKYREALNYIDPYLKKYPPVDEIDRLRVNAALTSINLGLGDLAQAGVYGNKLLEDFKVKGAGEEFVLPTLMNYFIKTRQFDKAAEYIARGEAYYANNKRVRELAGTYHYHFKLDSTRQDYLTSIKYYQLYKTLTDSIYNERKSKQLQELEVQYETEKKDQNIKLLQQQTELQTVLGERKDRDLKLREQDILLLQRQSDLQLAREAKRDQDLVLEKQNVTLLTRQRQLQEAQAKDREKNIELLTNQSKLQETQLQQANLMRNVTIAGVLLLCVLVGLLFNRYQIKQRSNQEISKKNTALQLMVNEKELLMKEIHHRVKNNLHMVMSLLESQSAYLKNDALEAIQDSQHRVYAMSIIHQKLYQGETVTTIDLAVYLPELVNNLRDSFVTRGRVRFAQDIASLWVDISQAVPLGLIVNEALTNALKYAFPNQGSGEISIVVHTVSDTHAELVIADNGVGLPQAFDALAVRSLGMTLMKGLSDEIDGKFCIESKHGTTVTVTFPTMLSFEDAPPKPGSRKKEILA